MRHKIKTIFYVCLPILVGVFVFSQPLVHGAATNRIHVIQLDDDTINPVTAEYIIKSIDHAENQNAQCLIIKMDTPGGLLSSTRLVVKKMLTAKLPVIVYISPSGSRAGSAGVFITYASHIAAMAPSTNIGAAHPVQMGGQELPKKEEDWQELKELIDELKTESGKEVQNPDDASKTEPDPNPMESKILNDTTAFIRAIAEARGRNVEWAVESVTQSASITDQEAKEKGVIEMIAENDQDLLGQLNGRTVIVNGNEVVLNTKDVFMEYVKMDARQMFFNILANPNIAYFLMILGFYGLLYEITHPGFGAPGVIGAIFLILSFYSMQTLPTNYAGLALMALGIILLIAEAFTPSFGLLTLGGLTGLVLGSLLLFESADPIMRVSISAILTFSISTAIITIFLMRAALRTKRLKVKGGSEGIIGEIGEARSKITPTDSGKIFVHGEIWNATSDEEIKKGEAIKILEVNGLTLKVRAQHAAPVRNKEA